MTGGTERIRHFTDARGGRPRLDDADVRRLHARKTARYNELVATGRVGLPPGVARLLAEARAAGVPLAIATTTSPPNVEALLTALPGHGVLGWFAVIAAGDAVPAKKPAPDVYLLALRELGLQRKRRLRTTLRVGWRGRGWGTRRMEGVLLLCRRSGIGTTATTPRVSLLGLRD